MCVSRPTGRTETDLIWTDSRGGSYCLVRVYVNVGGPYGSVDLVVEWSFGRMESFPNPIKNHGFFCHR